MPTQKGQSSRNQTSSAGCISIHLSDSESPSVSSALEVALQGQLPANLSAPYHLFEHAQEMTVSLPERYPRLTFLVIAVVLLASALTAEFDYLRGAGYYWP